MKNAEIPKYLEPDMLDYLDDLRESGVTNMYGAASYVQREFPQLSKKQSKVVLVYWMNTFSTRHAKE